jgi:hypothetical protein
MWNSWCMQRTHRNNIPLSFLFHLKGETVSVLETFWLGNVVFEKRRSREVFNTLVGVIELHHYHKWRSMLKEYRTIPLCSYVIFEHPYIVNNATLLSFCFIAISVSRFQWPRDLRRGSAAARFLRLRVRISPGAWMFVSCECCVL